MRVYNLRSFVVKKRKTQKLKTTFRFTHLTV